MLIDFVNGNYKLLDLDRDQLSKQCFEGIAVQKNWSNKGDQDQETIDTCIQFFTVLSPFLAREFLTFLVYSLSHFDRQAFTNSKPKHR